MLFNEWWVIFDVFIRPAPSSHERNRKAVDRDRLPTRECTARVAQLKDDSLALIRAGLGKGWWLLPLTVTLGDDVGQGGVRGQGQTDEEKV
jgi:hypothetical protein